MLRSLFTLRDVALFGLLLLGCASGSEVVKSTSCTSDSDCSSGQKCHSIGGPGQRPAVVAPPCLGYPACTTSAGCPSGTVCGPSSQLDSGGFMACPATVCMPPCPSRACRADEACAASGLCELLACDQPSAPPCAEHWHCDPAAAASAATTPTMGSTETDDPTRAGQRGCVRTRCDQSGGFVCLSDWECAPDRATENTGCAAIPCDRLGHCSSDTYYICQPTSSGPRPDVKDPFGCVPRNCEEGYECMFNYNGENFAYCDAGSPGGDDYGCHVHTCTEMPSACISGSFRCDPTASTADRLGCVPVSCSDGYVCADGWTCDPAGVGPNQFGCVPIASGTGGAGGAGGSGGSSGSAGSSGSSGAGSAGVDSGGASGTAGVAGATGGTGAVGGTSGASGGTAGSAGLNGSGGSSVSGGNGASGGTSGAGAHVSGMCVAE